MLADSGHNVLLFGSKEELPQLQTLVSSSSPKLGEVAAKRTEGCVTVLAGKQSFAEELEIIKNLDLMVSMDSFNMHIASVLGVPVVSIWGATHPDFGFYPQQQPRSNALCANLPCQPCSAFGQKACRYGDYRCLTAITPEMVFQKIQKILKSPTP
jgi:ADP-heptose:LPS heptosyltransferase